MYGTIPQKILFTDTLMQKNKNISNSSTLENRKLTFLMSFLSGPAKRLYTIRSRTLDILFSAAKCKNGEFFSQNVPCITCKNSIGQMRMGTSRRSNI